jgi:hypothetical protein
MKMMLIELDMYIPSLSDLDEIKEIENIIVKSYSKNNKLIHVKPDKYKLKIFQQFKEAQDNEEYLFKSPILSIEDGFEEMILISDQNTINIVKTMKENFELFEDNNLNMETEEEKLKSFQLTQKLLNVENPKIQKIIPTEEEIEKLTNLLDKHCNRVVFLSLLSGPRGRGQFEISQLTFDTLSKLLNKVINKVENDNDYYSAENVIIISQTYYIIEEKENKIYLQKNIEKNEIFKSKKFWEELLDFCINKEIVKNVSNDVKNGNILKENRKDAQDKMSKTAFGKIANYSKDMKDFGLDKESIIQIVSPKMEKFRMSKELIELVKNIINTY